MEPLITIIIPVYNAEKFITKCLDSILNQTYTRFEAILIDDGSTDASPNICDHYAATDTRFRVLHQRNSGIGAARNLGLANMKGSHVTFIDADDYIQPTHLHNFVTQLTHNYDWVMLGIHPFDENGNTLDWTCCQQLEFQALNRTKMDSYADKMPTFFWVTSKLYKAELIRTHHLRFITTSNIGEDKLFNFEYFQFAHSMKYNTTASCATYNYFFNTQSITRANRKQLPARYFLSAANRADEVLGHDLLGPCMSLCVADYCAQFYSRALGLCFLASRKAMSVRSRAGMLSELMGSIRRSVVLKRYKFTFFKLLCRHIGTYAGKL